MNATRGIRNNNPANIRKGDKWLGLSPVQVDRAFCQFSSMVYGVRALIKTLHTYVTKHGLHTIDEIINRYAPSNENNTQAYINTIKSMMSAKYENPTFQANDFFVNSMKLYLLCYAMCKIESNYILNQQMFVKAFALTGIKLYGTTN